MKIVFFGDSITEGCFEIVTVNGKIEVLRDQSTCYAQQLSEHLCREYRECRFEFFNAGVSGDAAADGLKRIQTQVIERGPDLVVMCFGLNDVYYRDPEVFAGRLGKMFQMLRKRDIPTVYMTPNMLNRYVSPNTHEAVKETAQECADCQNSGVLDRYMEAAKNMAAEYGVYVADAYAKWKKLDTYGVDTTQLLCNWINHPSRKMHALFADTLFACIQDNQLIKE